MTTNPTGRQDQPLTGIEVLTLAEDTAITVIWSGGNGPHDYLVAVDADGQRYAAVPNDPTGRFRFYNPLRFVGREPYHARVWLREDTRCG